MKAEPGHRRLLTAIDTALGCILLVVVVQIWLLTASVEAALAGDRAISLPALLASGACFAVNAGLLRFILRLDRLGR